MNLPNAITIFRVCLIPFFLYFYERNPYAALIIFVLASLSDFADGYIARRFNLVTNFGKLMDPLADKLLVTAALIVMAGSIIPVWAVVLLIAREFYISGVRQLALEQSIVIAASWWAKVKTAVQMIMIIFFLIPLPSLSLEIYNVINIVNIALITASVALSLVSAVEYTIKNKQVFGSLK
jgi:CDP-diacylglycerol--glycerol-3-phosphate 3-phosphatidyltransferase